MLATPLAAQKGPPTIGVEVENTTANPVPVVVTGSPGNPVPVVVTGGRAEELITFKTGYVVPAGKRLLLDDVSVVCFATGALPISQASGGVADFERYGISATAILRIMYPVASCPEEPSGGTIPTCPAQDHVLGTAQTNGTNAIGQTSAGKGQMSIGAGRQITAFADQEGRLFGFCSGSGLNFDSSAFRGTGRLIDLPH